jgi:enamine deaminase RidA (YjgF/YER057c/UK114 family)
MKALLLIIGLLMSSITAVHAQTVDYDKKLKELGIELPSASPPAANYVKAVRVGDVLHLSGHAAVSGFHGKLGKDMTTEQGYQAARSTAVSVLATLKQELGDLNRVKRIVKVMGMVNSTPEYTEQHLVTNGFSDLRVAVFGDKGKHARSRSEWVRCRSTSRSRSISSSKWSEAAWSDASVSELPPALLRAQWEAWLPPSRATQ